MAISVATGFVFTVTGERKAVMIWKGLAGALLVATVMLHVDHHPRPPALAYPEQIELAGPAQPAPIEQEDIALPEEHIEEPDHLAPTRRRRIWLRIGVNHARE